MRTFAALLVAMLVLAGRANAQEKPAGPPPAFRVVEDIDKDKGRIIYKETTITAVPVQKEVVANINGMLVKQVVTESVPITTTATVAIDLAKSKIIMPAGKEVALDDVWKRLKKGAVIVVSADGNAPGEVYLKALSADTLVVTPPRTMQRINAPVPGVVAPKPLPEPARK